MRIKSDFEGISGTYTFSPEEGERKIRAHISTGLATTTVKIDFVLPLTPEGQSEAFKFANKMRDMILELAKES